MREVLDGIRRLVRVLRLSARAAERDVGLSGAQLFVLQTLGKSRPLSLNELADATSTDQSSVSVVVRRLLGHGLVAKKPDPTDKRRVRLSLTKNGRALFRRAPHAAQEDLLRAVTQATSSDRLALARLLSELVERLGGDGEGSPPMLFDEIEPGARRVRAGAPLPREHGPDIVGPETRRLESEEEAMNQKTAKLLQKYPSQTGKDASDLKKWWEGLLWKQRAAERARIQKELQEK